MGIVGHQWKSCEERDRLTAVMDTTGNDYVTAANELVVRMGILDEAKYKVARAEVQRVWREAENAREALMKHRREHGC